jgi:hypothetical protein
MDLEAECLRDGDFITEEVSDEAFGGGSHDI